MASLFLGVLVILEAAALAIGYLLAPDNAGAAYWGSICWICLLIALNWYTSAVVFDGNERGGQITHTGNALGGLPGIGIAVGVYSLSSLGLLMLTVALGLVGWSLQFVSQIALLAIAITITLLASIAIRGSQYSATSTTSKADILEQIRRIQRLASTSDAKASIGDGLSYVTNQMPHPSRLNQAALAAVVESLAECDFDDSERIEKIFSDLKRC
jgi:hypothetical protein